MKTGAQTLLRVTGDAPLIDPGLIDYLVKGMTEAGGDFAQLEEGMPCAHEGADVFSRHALDWLVTNAGNDEVAREHVTSWFKHNPGRIETVHLPAYAPLACKSERISVDTEDDLAFICAVYERLGAAPGELPLTAVLKLLRDEPHYRAINGHIRQKPLTEVERPAVARRLGIGTVQFGQPYGISNRRGQVPPAEARAILARAAQAGIGLLDTAATDYGEGRAGAVWTGSTSRLSHRQQDHRHPAWRGIGDRPRPPVGPDPWPGGPAAGARGVRSAGSVWR